MSEKKKRPTPASKCTCTHCGVKAHAIPNSMHRKCVGKTGDVKTGDSALGGIQATIAQLGIAPKAMRGVWI